MPDTTSDAAREGTAAHELAEWCLTLEKPANFYLGAAVKVDDKEFIVDQEMAEAVQLYLDVIKADYEEMMPGVKMLVEEQFVLDWINDNIFGTNDCLLGQEFGMLRVYDLKYGRGVAVEVEANEQLMIYALGALHNSTYEEVEIVIVQPRAIHGDGPVRRWRISAEDLMAWGKGDLKDGAELALDDKSEVHAGDWCRFCKAIAICPAVKEQAQALAKTAFDDGVYVYPTPESMSGEEIAKLLKFTATFSTWAADVAAFAKAELERGRDIPGHKLVRGRRNRKWTDEADVIKALSAGYKAEIYEDPKLRSVAQMEKMITKAGGDPEAAMAGLVDITRPITMAPESDKREAVTPALEAFND